MNFKPRKMAREKPKPNAKHIAIISLTFMLMTSFTALAKNASTADAAAQSHEDTTDQAGQNYQPGDALSTISEAKDTAEKNGKRLLVIMGANWCHDSRALASRIERPPLKNIIHDHFETVFVDVGNLDKGRDVITSLGVPVYYATPTILIIDPVSGALVNADNRHQWGNAANISMEDTVEYFQQMATAKPQEMATETGRNGELSLLLSEIEAFEKEQANRVYAAYAKLAPMLEAYNRGDRDKFSDKIWDEVRDFRSQIPTDLAALRLEAHQRVKAGETGIKLKFPEYPVFSWDKKRRK